MSTWAGECLEMEENKAIFSGENLFDSKPSEAGLENCFTCFRKTDDYLRITESDGVSGDNLEAVFAQHFWFTKNEYHNQTVCKSCWEKIDDFHRFYCEVEKAYAPPALAEIKLESVEDDDEGNLKDDNGGAESETNDNDNDAAAAMDEGLDDDDTLPIEDDGMIYAEPLCKLEEGKTVAPKRKTRQTVTKKASSDTESDSDIPLAKRKTKRKSSPKIKPKSKMVPSEFTCQLCFLEDATNAGKFPSFTKLKNHSLKVHGKDPVIRCCCEKTYTAKTDYLDHFPTHGEADGKRCYECKITFREVNSYARHMLVIHTPDDQKQFKCTICPKAFAVQEMLNSHLSWHQEIQQKNHHCTICNRYFFSDGFLEAHMKKQHGPNASGEPSEKPEDPQESKVELGDDEAGTKRVWDVAEIARQEELIHKYITLGCPQCQYIAETFADLRRHARIEHGLNMPWVNCCQKKYFKRVKLYEHCLTHVNPDHFKCDLCGKVFKDGYNLKHHKWYIHTPMSERPFKCDVCGYAFVKDYLLKTHMSKHLDKEQKRHYCEQCDKVFNTGCGLKNHMQSVHGELSRWTCDICARQFFYRALLENHRKTHTKEGVAQTMKQCEKCGQWLTSQKNYMRHKRRTCESNGPMKCPLCDYEAKSLNALDLHKNKKHRERRMYPCSYCGKEFNREIRLKEHEANHAGIVLYKCPHCPRMCNSSSNMYTHKKVAHPEQWAAEVARKKAPPTEWYKLQ